MTLLQNEFWQASTTAQKIALSSKKYPKTRIFKMVILCNSTLHVKK